MKSNIYIHIGLHKTGTSSIQATMFRNRAKLLTAGINYLAIKDNHSAPLVSLFSDEPLDYLPNRRAAIDSDEKLAARNEAVAAALRHELETNRSDSLVISGEGLSTLHGRGVVRLRDMFAPYAQRFRIIAYLRDPYAYVASMFQQRLRRGETEASIVAGGGMRPNYRSIGHYRRAFGAANVDVRIFDPSRFPNGDVIADFMAAIEAPAELTRELEVVRANTALSHEASLLAGALNRLFPLGEDRRQNPERTAALMETLAEIPGQPYRCPAEVIAASRPLIETELAWLHKTLGRELFSAKPPSPQAAPLWDEKTLAAIALRLNELAKLKSVSGAQGENRSGWRALLRRLGFE